jgi:hypothetical protein
MNQFERNNKSMYSAGLAGNLAYRDNSNTPNSTVSSKKLILRDSSFSATEGGDSAFSFQQQQQGNVYPYFISLYLVFLVRNFFSIS